MPRPFDLNTPVGPGDRASRPFNAEQPAQLNQQVQQFKDQCAAQTTQGNIPWPPAGPACPSGKPFKV
jgi:hypothetical protein